MRPYILQGGMVYLTYATMHVAKAIKADRYHSKIILTAEWKRETWFEMSVYR